MKNRITQVLLLSGLSMAAFFSTTALAIEENSTLEKVNRSVFKFNDVVDKYTLKPVATVYNKSMPSVLNKGVSNVFSNSNEVRTGVNSILQGKIKNAGIATSRLLINSTLGMGGLFDVASKFKLFASKEDFSQTLGVWGVQKGPYLVLPFTGPATVRGVVGNIPDFYTSGVQTIEETSTRDKLRILNGIDARAKILDIESGIIGDRYSFIRDVYLARVDAQTLGAEAQTVDDDF